MTETLPIESHPWEPYIPKDARVLIMGTFPPAAKRWPEKFSFYYPNPINDFWRIMGLIYYGDKDALWLPQCKCFDLDAVKALLDKEGIAMNDTVRQARRLMGNASDKYLEVVEPVPLADLLAQMPQCRAIATTGEKAAQIVADITGTRLPKMGECVAATYAGRPLAIWRMPSTSRAYPMKLADKAAYYRRMLATLTDVPPIPQ